MNMLLKDWEVNGLKEISYDYVATLRAHLALCVLSFKVRSSNMIGLPLWLSWGESACSVGDLVQSLGWEDPLEKGKATHSSILAWRILWTV